MKLKKMTAVLGATALVVSCLGGCGSSKESASTSKTTAKSSDDVDMSEKVDISIGGLSLFDSATTTWPTEVIKAVEEKFNCTITVKPYDQESLNLDLSGGNTTDIVQIADANIEGVLKGKHAVNLLDYKNIAPNIFSDDMNYRNTIMQNFKSDGDDTQYFVTPHVVTDNAEKNYGSVIPTGYVVRWDLYKQIGCPEINNDDDYIEALKAMKELYPKTEDGLETYAMSAYNDSDLHTYFFKGCLGEGYVNLEDGLYVQDAKTNDLVVDVYDKDEDVKTPFWSGVEFYNKLYREGLLDPDNFITQGEDLTEKYTKGQYLGGTVNWFYGTYNTNNKGTDKEYIALPSKLGWVNEPNKAGWTGKYLFVSSHSPNIERAVMVLDYLQSSEFARSAESGIEGRWEKGDDGKPHLTEDTMSMKTDSSRADEWKASGISDSGTDNLVGWDYNDVLPDGGLVNLWNDEDVMKANLTTAEQDLCKQFDIDLPSDLLKKRIEDGTSMDLSDANPTIRMCLWYVLCYSFSDTTAASVNPPVILPSGFTLSNYKEILTLKGFFPALGMSVLRTVVGTGLSVFCCSFLAYLFTKDKMPARKILYRFVVFTMYISGGMIATYIVMKSYGLLNNFWVYILPTMISAYNMILIKTYIEQLPPALEESAALDGAGYITCFFKIILPLCKPIIATVVVFVAVGQWNSWFDNHIYTRANESLTTLQYLLYNYLNEAQRLAEQLKTASSGADMTQAMAAISPKGIRMTITVLASLPIFALYPFMQKYFSKGIMVGAVKG